jgi:uncharacterized protein YaaN involved in tellurite resistance
MADSKVDTAAPATPIQAMKETTSPEAIAGELVEYQAAPPDQKARIDKALAELDITDSNSVIFFGAKAQEELTSVSDSMLEGVRNKDTGPAGEALGDMLVKLRGFKVDDLAPGKKPGFFARLFGAVTPVARFVQRYEEVRDQVDAISNRLDGHKTTLMTDIEKLDRLYDANLDYFHDLADYIAAGDEKLRQLDGEVIPAKAQEVEGSEEALKAQELRDIRQTRDDLERRVHDLKLTRQVAMQSLPSIRLVQENDKALVTKINSTMVNTIPLWKQQLAQAVTIYRAHQAAETVKEATDLTNELLVQNAKNLKTANAEVREQIERGVVDIDSIKEANKLLIDTIEDSLRIADEGKAKRAEAEKELVSAENDLRQVLKAASASKPAPAAEAE